jgi:large subunit ribosomal protein L6
MSRIGKVPVPVPANVEVLIESTQQGLKVTVKGSLGTLTRVFRPEILIQQVDNQLIVSKAENSRMAAALFGLSRTLLNNMVVGVSQGFTKNLEVNGVGYRFLVQDSNLHLSVGYSHPVVIQPPSGVEFVFVSNTKLEVKGISKEDVGQIASVIRSKRPPEPYKGKGVKYAGEFIARKAGKAGKK